MAFWEYDALCILRRAECCDLFLATTQLVERHSSRALSRDQPHGKHILVAYKSRRFVERILLYTRCMVVDLPVQLIVRNGDLIGSDSNIVSIRFVQYDQILGPHVSRTTLSLAHDRIETDVGSPSSQHSPCHILGKHFGCPWPRNRLQWMKEHVVDCLIRGNVSNGEI